MFTLPAIAALAAIVSTTPAPAAAQAVPHYRSAFDGYRPFDDVPLQPWRESNQRVAHIGGWKSYLREAHGAAPQPASAPDAADAQPQPSPAASPPPHQGHPHHGHPHQGHPHHGQPRPEHPRPGPQPAPGRAP